MRNFSRDDRSGGRSFGGNRGGFGGRSSGRDSGRPTMYDARCDECGVSCQVPFKPSGDKPVLCSSCFQDSRGERNDRNDRGSRDRNRDDRFGRNERPRFEEKRMFQAVCDGCGETCEVPFKPNGDKPVFCNHCFGREDKGTFEKKAPCGNIDVNQLKEEIKAEMKEQFDVLNAKLDKILRKFAPVVSAKDLPASAIVAEPDEDDEEIIVEKKIARKKAATKKAE